MPGPSSIVEAFSLSHAQILDGNTPFLEAALATSVDAALDIYGVNNGSLSPDSDSYDNEGDDQVLSTWYWLNKAEIEIQSGYLSFPLLAEMYNQDLDEIGAVAAVDEVQTITVSATGGTFTISVGGQTTDPIAYNASNTAVRDALLALSTVDTGDIAVSGSAGTYILTYGGDYAGRNVPLAVIDDSSATGGDVTIAQTTPGNEASAGAFATDLWHEDSFNSPTRPAILRMPSKDHYGNVRNLTIGLYKVQFAPIEFDGPAYKDGLKVNYNATALMSAFDETGVEFSDGKKRVGRLLSHA